MHLTVPRASFASPLPYPAFRSPPPRFLKSVSVPNGVFPCLFRVEGAAWSPSENCSSWERCSRLPLRPTLVGRLPVVVVAVLAHGRSRAGQASTATPRRDGEK